MSSAILPLLEESHPPRVPASSPQISRRQSPIVKCSEASQDNATTSYQLTVQGFLHGIRKQVSSQFQPSDVVQTPKLQSNALTGNEDLLVFDSAATMSGRGLLDPPESTSSDTDSEQVLSSGPEARRLQSANAGIVDGSHMLMKIPRVVRTYTRKIKHASPVRKDNSTLSLNRPGALLDGILENGSDTPTGLSASRKSPKAKSAKKRISAVHRKRKEQTLQVGGEACREVRSEDDTDMGTTGKDSKTKRKKRRAPVNQLALVARPKSYEASGVGGQKPYDSGNAIDPLYEYVNEQVSPISTSPNPARSRKPMRANVGKPVTKIRKELSIPHKEFLDRGRFKVLPITPRATKPPGWKLGSGFDGITLEPSGSMRPRTSRNQNVGNTRTPRYLSQSRPHLDFSTELSPTRESVDQRGIPERQESHGEPVETVKADPTKRLSTADSAYNGGLAQRAAEIGIKGASEQVANLIAPIHPPAENDHSGTVFSHHDRTVKEPIQVHLSQSKNLAASQMIREPSKSERNGWLKRKRVDFAIADEDEGRLPVRTRPTSVNGSVHGRKSGKTCLETRLQGATQAQNSAENDLLAFHGGGQTAQEMEWPVTSQKQRFFQGESSAMQHRRRVSHAVEVESLDPEDEASNHQSLNRLQDPKMSLETEAHLPSSGFDPRGPSVPKTRHSIQIPRISEIPETQDVLQESIEIDGMRIEPLDFDRQPFQISQRTMDCSKYFSKAVQQLESPDIGPHTVTRRRSRRELGQEASGSPIMSGMQRGLAHGINIAPFVGEERNQKPEEILRLGVTSRLKRRMSNIPFRPPFMEAL